MKLFMRRRSFLFLVVSTLGVLSSKWRHGFTFWAGATMGTADIAELLGVIKHRSSAKIVGLDYIKSVPGEADVNKLLALVSCSDDSGSDLLSRECLGAPENWFSLRLQDDFAHGRTVVVNGWLLSQTEARLCALVALA